MNYREDGTDETVRSPAHHLYSTPHSCPCLRTSVICPLAHVIHPGPMSILSPAHHPLFTPLCSALLTVKCPSSTFRPSHLTDAYLSSADLLISTRNTWNNRERKRWRMQQMQSARDRAAERMEQMNKSTTMKHAQGKTIEDGTDDAEPDGESVEWTIQRCSPSAFHSVTCPSSTFHPTQPSTVNCQMPIVYFSLIQSGSSQREYYRRAVLNVTKKMR